MADQPTQLGTGLCWILRYVLIYCQAWVPKPTPACDSRSNIQDHWANMNQQSGKQLRSIDCIILLQWAQSTWNMLRVNIGEPPKSFLNCRGLPLTGAFQVALWTLADRLKANAGAFGQNHILHSLQQGWSTAVQVQSQGRTRDLSNHVESTLLMWAGVSKTLIFNHSSYSSANFRGFHGVKLLWRSFDFATVLWFFYVEFLQSCPSAHRPRNIGLGGNLNTLPGRVSWEGTWLHHCFVTASYIIWNLSSLSNRVSHVFLIKHHPHRAYLSLHPRYFSTSAKVPCQPLRKLDCCNYYLVQS